MDFFFNRERSEREIKRIEGSFQRDSVRSKEKDL